MFDAALCKWCVCVCVCFPQLSHQRRCRQYSCVLRPQTAVGYVNPVLHRRGEGGEALLHTVSTGWGGIRRRGGLQHFTLIFVVLFFPPLPLVSSFVFCLCITSLVYAESSPDPPTVQHWAWIRTKTHTHWTQQSSDVERPCFHKHTHTHTHTQNRSVMWRGHVFSDTHTHTHTHTLNTTDQWCGEAMFSQTHTNDETRLSHCENWSAVVLPINPEGRHSLSVQVFLEVDSHVLS